MVKLSDLSPENSQHLLDKDCPEFETSPFVAGSPLRVRRVAILTTAGLHRRDDNNFDVSDLSYRVIPGDVQLDDLVMTQASVNFDRTGFHQDINVVFPIDRLKELDANGTIGSIAKFHYAFMGAGSMPQDYEKTACDVAGFLKQDNVDAVFLTPV